MNKTRHLATLLLVLLASLPAMAWGRKGHDAVAAIAQNNLTPQARERIERYLDNHSIIYYSSWLDWVRPQQHYAHTGRWHTFYCDTTCTYTPNRRHDNVAGMEKTLGLLRNYHEMSDSAVADNIKILVHLVGDLHCPSHAYFPDHSQGDVNFTIVGERYNFHTFWDSGAINPSYWTYTEYVEQLDRCDAATRDSIAAGTPIEWACETGRVQRPTQAWFIDGDDMGKATGLKVRIDALEVAHLQLLRGGYRLARLLNEIFTDPREGKPESETGNREQH